ncbi:MAG TPA: nucleoside-diphosphate kinase [Candidatus Limisoma intestinavium]|uniref:Nucleoside diphosphate kinase n=1 Tax=Candidatus Limisoma intestinavium TaxID=2840856 RepID=A0A9D1IN39_9BACT|nr:nucleoside-diphosphate kinase [Candidatus Limisoma intestinavium]
MEKTLVILKPSAVVRGIMGEIISRFERKGLIIIGMKMMRLSDELLKEHYAHLVDKPFFPSLVRSMQASPVVVLCVKGVDAVAVVRKMTGVTNGRNADTGTIRGDYSMSGQQNIVHASDTPENAEKEIRRFFDDGEITDYMPQTIAALYAEDEIE